MSVISPAGYGSLHESCHLSRRERADFDAGRGLLAGRGTSSELLPVLRHPRAAYTLVELTVVLAVMATLAAVAWPSISKTLAKGRVQEAAQRVVEIVSDARITALESGQVQLVRFQLDGAELQWGPANSFVTRGSPRPTPSAGADPQSLSGLVDVQEAVSPKGIRTGESDDRSYSSGIDEQPITRSRYDAIQQERLTSGIRFQQTPISKHPGSRDASRNPLTPEEPGVLGPLPDLDDRKNLSIRWSRPVYFYPDGSARGQLVTLRSDEGWHVRLRFNEWTASVSMDPVRRAARRP